MDSWDKLNAMLKKSMSKHFRNELQDSFGNGWKFNWFCLDHVGFKINPRRRTIGYHAIHDHYANLLKRRKIIRLIKFNGIFILCQFIKGA